ncbi:MAG: hypothetical protein R3A44_01270 [Caldilineaceae bacterium]
MKFTVGQIARALRCHERSARLYLREVNENIDCYAQNLSELVDGHTLVALCRRYENQMLGRRLIALLQNA